MRVDLLAVEGAHDLAFVQRILKAFGFGQRFLLKDVPREGKTLIPSSFPTNIDGHIHTRADVPSFHVKAEQCVVLLSAGGDSKLVKAMSNAISKLALINVQPSSVGFILDADEHPLTQRKNMKDKWEHKRTENDQLASYPFPPNSDFSAVGTCPFGVFVMPDNQSTGTLECILLKQAKTVYPVLHDKADAFIQTVKTTVDAIPPGSELTATGKHEGKAVLHAMTSVLKPGKTLQTSIADHAWFPEDPNQFPKYFDPFITFLKQLLGL